MEVRRLAKLEQVAKGYQAERKAVTIILNEAEGTQRAIYSDGVEEQISKAQCEALRQNGKVLSVICQTAKGAEETARVCRGERT